MSTIPRKKTASRTSVKHGPGRWIVATVLVALLISIAIVLFSAKPPLAEIDAARAAVARARSAEAPYYAAAQWHVADSTLDTMMGLWEEQNRRVFFLRDFNTIKTLANQTILTSDSAGLLAQTARSTLETSTSGRIAQIKRTLTEFRRQYDNIPMPTAIRRKAAAGEMLLSESQSAFKRKDYRTAFDKCRKAAEMIGVADRHVSEKMEQYMTAVPRWRAWVDAAIAESRRNRSLVIIVEKIAHTCKLYSSGGIRYEFTADLGPHWIGHKTRQGDGATPEGCYTITQKKTNSKYYKALVINYPNQNDRDAFNSARRRGEVPPGASLGGLIEIHGHGGKGANWTEGCVALKNDDMKKLFDAVGPGTPVVIVGTLTENNDPL